jgi:hypothetical protein
MKNPVRMNFIVPSQKATSILDRLSPEMRQEMLKWSSVSGNTNLMQWPGWANWAEQLSRGHIEPIKTL